MIPLSLCVLLLLANTSPLAMGGSATEQPGQPSPGAASIEIASPAPEDAEPPPGEIEAWATRYPKEYQDWRESIHGSAYLSGNGDAPACTHCHEDPESVEIRTAAFRLDIPSRCASCHDDGQLMRKYDVAADVYASYRADYHGLTIDYYRDHDPSLWRYEAVCSDCHRSHAVHRASDSRSSVAPANLLGTCQQCHPGAEANFTSTATGHFRTDRDSSLLTYYIELIYRILIPVVIGLMAIYVGLDMIHRLRKKLTGTL